MKRSGISYVFVGLIAWGAGSSAVTAESAPEGLPKPGKWEFVSRYVSNPSVAFPMPLPPKRESVCLTEADFSQGKLPLHSMPGCAIASASLKGKALDLTFACTNPDIRPGIKQNGQLTLGEDTAEGSARISFGKDLAGNAVNFDYRFEGRRTGSCP